MSNLFSTLSTLLKFPYSTEVLELFFLNKSRSYTVFLGESHITVITPPEFALLSTANVTIEQVDSIAKKLNIQKSKVSIVCLGREEVVENGTDMIVYQIIVKAPNLNKIREEIFKVYYQQGGNPALFDPNVSLIFLLTHNDLVFL